MAAGRLSDLTERTDVLRIPLHSVEQSTMPELVEALLAEEGVSQIVMLRWWDFMKARRQREFGQCVRRASLSIPVSKTLVAGARFLRRRRPERHLPFDFTIRLLGALEDRGRSIYLLGGTSARLRIVEQNLRQTFPGLRVVGRYTGYFSAEVEADIITAVRKAQPDFILVGAGVPGGDKWVYRNREALGSSIALCSAETFDVLAEKRQRTSRAAFRRGTDFLPVLFRRPWRILRLPVYLWYLFLLLIFKIFGR